MKTKLAFKKIFFEEKLRRYKILYLFLFIYIFIGAFIPSDIYAQEEWETITSSNGSSATARHENAYVKCGNKFYLLGSRGTKKVQIYDPETKTWTDGASVPIEMNHFQAVEYHGLIYVAGAFTGGYPTETPLANIYIYNPSSNTWATGPEIPADRRRGSAGTVVYNNKIYLVSGITNGHTSGHVTWFDEFDPVTGIWKILPDAPHARDHYHAALSGNKIILAGGRNSSYPNTFGITRPEVDVYDFSTNTWTTMPHNLPTPRAGASVVVLNNEVLVIGGESMAHMEAHKETEALDLASGNWRSLAMLKEGRHGTQAIVHNNEVFIVAGSNTRGGNSSTELSSQEKYTSTGTVEGLKGEKEFMNISFYPNPCDEKITLHFNEENTETLYLKIYNNIGNNIRELTASSISDILIDTSELSEGIYFVNIKGEKEGINQSIKIIKK